MRQRAAIAAAIVGVAIGLGLAAPAAGDQEPSPPAAGTYHVTESWGDNDSQKVTYDWLLSACGATCVHVRSVKGEWDIDMHWIQTQWVGNRSAAGGLPCSKGGFSGPVDLTYGLRPALTGWVSMNFSPDQPGCGGVTEPQSRDLVLVPA